jgi:uncharacterized protein YycO
MSSATGNPDFVPIPALLELFEGGRPGFDRGLHIALFRGRGVISTAIRWQTRSRFSHAALLDADGSIIEAWQGKGVRRHRLEDWQDIDIFRIEASRLETERALSYAADQIGCGYDYLSVLRFVSRRHAPENSRWFCSELVFAACCHAGINLLRDTQPWEVSPGMLARSPLLQQLHWLPF